MSIQAAITQSVNRGTDAVAAGAVTSPFWLPTLRDVSEVAGLLVPILGASWLLIQIVNFFGNRKK